MKKILQVRNIYFGSIMVPSLSVAHSVAFTDNELYTNHTTSNYEIIQKKAISG
jgi:hypothetical protein